MTTAQQNGNGSSQLQTVIAKVPTIADLFEENLEIAFKNEQLNLLLNHEPRKEWIKVHPIISNYRYIPIDKVEFLLRKIFQRYRIEITGQGSAFNGVWVTVRVHYFNPVSGEWDYHDGIGACQLQTKSGSSPADLININNGALSMAFPIAKTVAIKDACDHFGKLFGCDLNRKDTIPFSPSIEIPDVNDLRELYELKKDSLTYEERMSAERIIDNNEVNSFKKLHKQLQSK